MEKEIMKSSNNNNNNNNNNNKIEHYKGELVAPLLTSHRSLFTSPKFYCLVLTCKQAIS